MRYPVITVIALFLVLASISFASAVYYIETSTPSTNVHGYGNSMYLNPDFAPRADLFYTPFNAYRTYCDASYCPSATKIVYVKESAPLKKEQPKMVVVHYSYYYSTPTYYANYNIYNKPIAPIYLH
jgi:hypothetical protein